MPVGARNATEAADAAAMIAHPVPPQLWLALRAQGHLSGDVPLPGVDRTE